MPALLPGIDTAAPNATAKKKSVKKGSKKSNKSGRHPDAQHSASPAPRHEERAGTPQMEGTGVPWLDNMQEALKAEYRETALLGQKMGTHEAFTSKFAPQLRGSGEMPPPPDYTRMGNGSAENTVTSTALVPASQSLATIPSTASRRLAPLPSISAGVPVPVPYAPTVSMEAVRHANSGTAGPKTCMNLRDYQLLATACQRGGRGKTEANAYYKMGELCSKNPDTVEKAGRCFERYYTLSKHLKDVAGEAKALNCLGIVHQQRGDLEAALQCHEAHLAIAPPSSQFIARTNLGVTKMHMGLLDEALQAHKDAMHSAIRTGDKQAELVALANLGLVGQKQKDFSTAQICMSRHLELAQVINDPTSQQAAYEQLAVLQAEKGDWEGAQKYFNDARGLCGSQRIAPITTNSERLKCKIGFVKATGSMDTYFRDMASKMQHAPLALGSS